MAILQSGTWLIMSTISAAIRKEIEMLFRELLIRVTNFFRDRGGL